MATASMPDKSKASPKAVGTFRVTGELAPLRVSSYDRFAGLLMTLLIFIGFIVVTLLLPKGVGVARVHRDRLQSATTTYFVLAMVGASVILLAIALIFLRNQIRPIRSLAEVADGAGAGVEFHQGPVAARHARRRQRQRHSPGCDRDRAHGTTSAAARGGARCEYSCGAVVHAASSANNAIENLRMSSRPIFKRCQWSHKRVPEEIKHVTAHRALHFVRHSHA